jgi:hypothetical protein
MKMALLSKAIYMFSAVISVETISGMGWGRRIMVRG